MKKRRLIPFRWMPGSFGLTGNIYKEAEAAYYYEGEALAREIVKIRHHPASKDYRREMLLIDHSHALITEYELDQKMAHIEHDDKKSLQIALWNVDVIHGKLEQYECDVNVANLIKDDKKRELALLDVDFKHDLIKETAYNKKKATLNEEPWVDVIDHGFNPKEGINGMYFEIDWNEYWVEFLTLNGYTGPNDEAIVKAWFADVCSEQENHGPPMSLGSELYGDF